MKKLGVRFDGAKRDYGQSSRRFTIPASPSRHLLLPESQRHWAHARQSSPTDPGPRPRTPSPMFIRKNPAKPVEFDRSQEIRRSPDYRNGVTAGVAIAAHQRHILTDSLGDHDAVERVTMVIGQRHHA